MNDKARRRFWSTPARAYLSRLAPHAALLLTLIGGGLLTAQTAQDFTKIYDSYLAAVKAGKYSQVEPLVSAEIRNEVTSPEAQGQYMDMVRQMVPIKYETEFATVAKDGKSADVSIIGTFAVPEQDQKKQHQPSTQRVEMILKFVQEGGQWKMGPPTLLGDPGERARPKDLNMGTRADYAEGNNTEVGGAILRLEKQATGTVYIVRLPDQEIAVFVPAAKVSDDFVPGSILVIHGAENKTDKLKVWAEDASLYEEPKQ